MFFALLGIPGRHNSLQRARLYSPSGATVAEMALVEGDPQRFSGTIAISPTPADSTDAYEYEVRRVATQDVAGFNASSKITVTRGTFGYPAGGVWYDTAADAEEAEEAEPADDLTHSISENAQAPKRAAGDAGSVEQHSLPDQIAADKYLKSQSAGGIGLGVRLLKISPPGAADI